MEATLFAALMSILNGGSFTGSFLGSLLTKALGVTGEDFTHLAPLVLVRFRQFHPKDRHFRVLPNISQLPQRRSASPAKTSRTSRPWCWCVLINCSPPSADFTGLPSFLN